MDEKPASVECAACGEMIVPFTDGTSWAYGAMSQTDGEGMTTYIHHGCFEHPEIWNRIRTLEKQATMIIRKLTGIE